MHNLSLSPLSILIVMAGLLIFTAPAAARQSAWAPVPDSLLAQARGGFDVGGLLVALSVERLVSINGSMVADTRLNIPDVARLSADDAVSASRSLSAVLLQNSANDQLIRSQTTINTTVNSLSSLKSMNLEGSLRQVFAQVLTPR